MAGCSDTDDVDEPVSKAAPPFGFGVAGGAVVGVTAVAAAAVLLPGSAAQLVLVAVAVGVYAAVVGDVRVSLVTAGLTYLLFDGFLVNRYGELSWDGTTSAWHLFGFALALLLGSGHRLARAARNWAALAIVHAERCRPTRRRHEWGPRPPSEPPEPSEHGEEGRLKDTAISPRANGYPATQCSSGMCSKFMPYTVPTNVGAKKTAAQPEIVLDHLVLGVACLGQPLDLLDLRLPHQRDVDGQHRSGRTRSPPAETRVGRRLYSRTRSNWSARSTTSRWPFRR